MARVLEIVMKARNEIGGAVQSVQADMAKLRDSAQKFNMAFNMGVAVNAAKTSFVGLEAVIRAASGDASAMVEVLYRLPLGIGDTIRAAKTLWDVMTGVEEKARKAAEASKKQADAYKAMAESADYIQNARREFLSPGDQGRLDAQDRLQKELKEITDRYNAKIGATGVMDGMTLSEFMERSADVRTSEQKAARERYARTLQGIDDKEREDARSALIKRLDEEHRLDVDAFNKRVKEKQTIALEEHRRYIDMLRERQEREDENRQYNYRDWIESLRPGESGGGSTGTISTADISGRFRGLAEASRGETLTIARETKAAIEKQNKTLDAMLKLDEENGGALRRFFSSIGPL